MRTFITIFCVIVAAVAAVAIYLFVTTPSDAAPLAFPLSDAQQELLATVPADAEAYALVASPVVLKRKLLANPVTREAVARWMEGQPIPPPAMLGRADAVIWRTGKTTSYAVRFDPVRALLVRTWTMFSAADTRWRGRTLVINGGTQSASARIETPPALPEGDVFVVQRKGARGAFPPIARPAFTSVKITAETIDIASRAPSADPGPGVPPGRPGAMLPASAMLSVAFTEPPRILGDLDRLLGADVGALLGGGATLALYDVDSGTLLPRPFAAIVVPANDRSRAAAARYDRILQAMGQKLEQNGQLIVSFDRRSAAQYSKDALAPVPWPSNRWSLRLDPARTIPVLRKVGDNPALRFATPRLYRGARDLRRWMGALENAQTVEAVAVAGNGFEELHVRVASK